MLQKPTVWAFAEFGSSPKGSTRHVSFQPCFHWPVFHLCVHTYALDSRTFIWLFCVMRWGCSFLQCKSFVSACTSRFGNYVVCMAAFSSSTVKSNSLLRKGYGRSAPHLTESLTHELCRKGGRKSRYKVKKSQFPTMSSPVLSKNMPQYTPPSMSKTMRRNGVQKMANLPWLS